CRTMSISQWISSMSPSLPRRAAGARGHARCWLGLTPLKQFERGVHAGILGFQRLAHARVVEIERNAVDVLVLVIGIDAVALDGTARGREVARGSELDGAAFRERHHGLHGSFAESAPAQQHGAVMV